METTKRKYIAKVKRSRIDMAEAVTELTANAYKLLGLVYYGILDSENLDNDKAMQLLGVSRRPLFKAKDELKEKGYIKIHQIGSTKFVWVLGKDAIKKDTELYKNKSNLENEKFAKKILDYFSGITSNKDIKVVYGKEVIVLEGFEQKKEKGKIIEV